MLVEVPLNPVHSNYRKSMEQSSWNWEQRTLVSELVQGMELTKQLKLNLGAKSSPETREFLLQKILSSYEKALMILKWSGPIGQPQPQSLIHTQGATGSVPASPISADESPRSDDFDGGVKDHQDPRDLSKKR